MSELQVRYQASPSVSLKQGAWATCERPKRAEWLCGLLVRREKTRQWVDLEVKDGEVIIASVRVLVKRHYGRHVTTLRLFGVPVRIAAAVSLRCLNTGHDVSLFWAGPA